MENNVSQPKRIRELDILKGIAIILVIMGHSLLVYPVDFSDIPWAKALRWFIYSFHMPLFFLVAGVVYKCKSYLPYLGKKAQRILIPYAFFGIIEFICASLMSNLVNSKPQPLKDWLVSFFLLGREGWFLQTMFIICAVYPLVDLLLKKPILKLAFAALLIILNLFVKIPDYWALPSVVVYFPYFIIGDVAKDLVKNIDGIDTKKRICFAVCSALLFIASALPAYFLGISFSPLKIVYATAMTSFIFFTASLFHPPLGKICAPVDRFLTLCGENSLQIFLFQGFALTVFRTIICKFISSPIVIFALLVLLIVPSCVIACLIVKRIPILSYLCGYPLKKKS